MRFKAGRIFPGRVPYQNPSKHQRNRLISLALVTLLVCQLFSSAVANNPKSAIKNLELYQAVLDLSNPWTVMCVAAHPDDEDGATLTVLRRKYGAHTVSLFTTYGEGGQNAIGPELYEELGVIRARETMKAAAIQGSEPHFLAQRDFGFSKSADEAFRMWGREGALGLMVQQIRTLRPEVIITNHDTTSGHGHHQATGQLIEEAFDAAGDPKRFPNQLREVQVWRPQRLFVRINYESTNAKSNAEAEAERAGKVITINPNEMDPNRGSTYAAQALHALQQHASQGPWPLKVPAGGAPLIRYRLAREAEEAAPLPVGAQTFWDGLQLTKEVAELIKPPMIDGRPLTEFANRPELVYKALSDAENARAFRTVEPGSPEPDPKLAGYYRQFTAEEHTAMAAALGISLTLSPSASTVTPDSSITFDLVIRNNGTVPVTVIQVSFDGLGLQESHTPNRRLDPKNQTRFERELRLLPGAELYAPRWDWLNSGRFTGMPFSAHVMVEVAGHRIYVPVATTSINIIPSVEVAGFSISPLIITPAILKSKAPLKIQLINHESKPFEGKIAILTQGRTGSYEQPVALGSAAQSEIAVKLSDIPGVGDDPERLASEPVNIHFRVYKKGTDQIIEEKIVKVSYSDAEVAPGLRVGFVPSFDKSLRNALSALGVDARELTVADIGKVDLRNFDTILIDNRGYQAHPELIKKNARLLEFVRNGGTLVVFYHKASEWNPDPAKGRPQLSPYPIVLGSERVTDETAPVAFTEPENRLLNYPNKIGNDDFKDWIQERGLYFPKTWDARYAAPLATGDPGETPLRGGLLMADYGRGKYIYTSMVWYRQLRGGVPGGYRMFANMISSGRSVR
jgi:LmbE family N-acetylglucosaminyl deacetylase